nr:cytosine deaminase [Quercus suber]
MHAQSQTNNLTRRVEMSVHDAGFKAALAEAKAGASEGGIPIGACLVNKDGKILGQGHNLRVQNGSATLHVCAAIHVCFRSVSLVTSAFARRHDWTLVVVLLYKFLLPFHPSHHQLSSPTLSPALCQHAFDLLLTPYASTQAEIAAFECAGRLPPAAYEGATMYTTLSPCDMCTGACILYNIARVVLGEHETLVGGEDYLRAKGIEVVNLRSDECRKLMRNFIKEHPEDWYVWLSALITLTTYEKDELTHVQGMRISVGTDEKNFLGSSAKTAPF